MKGWGRRRRRSATSRSIALTIFANGAILLANIGTGIVTARLLGPDGRGEQAAIVLWPQFLAYIATLGLPTSLVFNIKREPTRRRSFVAAAAILGFGAGMVAIVIGFFGVPAWINSYPGPIVNTARWSMVAAPIQLLGLIAVATMQADEAFGAYNTARLAGPVLVLTIIGSLALTSSLTPISAGLAYVWGSSPVFLWMCWWVWTHYRPRLSDGIAAARTLLRYGIRSYGTELFTTLAAQLDRLLAVGFLQPIEMGYYVVALSLSRVLNAAQNAFVDVVYPRSAGKRPKDVLKLVFRAASSSFVLTASAASIILLLGPWLLGILYGSQFAGSILAFRLLLLEALLTGTARVLSQALMATGRPGIVTSYQGLSVTVAAVLIVILAPRFGASGAALALLSASVVRILATIFFVRRIANLAQTDTS